jgi:hypothetical protein
MAKELRADPVEMATLGTNCTTVATEVRSVLRKARDQITLPSAAFGNTTGIEDVCNTYGNVLEKAGLVFEDLADVLEGDTERLYQVAFSYKAQDEANAKKVHKPNPPPLPSPRPGPSPTPAS